MSSRKHFTLFVGIACAFAAGAGSVAIASDVTIALTGAGGHVSPVLTVPTIALPNISTWQQQSSTCMYPRLPMARGNSGALGLRGPPGVRWSRGMHSGSQVRRTEPLASVCCPGGRTTGQSGRPPRVTASILTVAPSGRAGGGPTRSARPCARGPAGSQAPSVLARAQDRPAGSAVIADRPRKSGAGVPESIYGGEHLARA
jgi:hypothetical protein